MASARPRLAAAARALTDLGEQLVLVYTRPMTANRIEWLWQALRRAITHIRQRQSPAELLADAQAWAHTITPAQVFSQIGSRFADDRSRLSRRNSTCSMNSKKHLRGRWQR